MRVHSPHGVPIRPDNGTNAAPRRHLGWLATLALIALASPAWAGDADVINVSVRLRGAGVFDLDVTIRSRDTGWDRYADRIEALAPDGTVLGTRVLEHPHDDEQPFTRDLHGVTVPAGIGRITVRARFKPTGYNGDTMGVALPAR